MRRSPILIGASSSSTSAADRVFPRHFYPGGAGRWPFLEERVFHLDQGDTVT
jgi:hypothetical protein